ncbi:MAG TPA: adenosylcobinamide-GDP ribazoletransferase [Chloroflexota bacterium]|jgi:adenosylcobinamide-GDP ribazoletransferase
MVRGFGTALQFLTRLPAPYPHATSAAQLGAALVYFPAVGALVGALLVALDAALRPLLLAPAVVDALLVATLVVVSGALHLDGLVDTCDAVCTRASPEARLALMHDSRAHAPGTIVACLLLLAKLAALQALPAAARVPTLLVAPLLARWAIVVAYWGYPYARQTPGASLALKAQATTPRAAAATAFALVVLFAALGPRGALVLAAAGLGVHLLASGLRTRLPGLTGDTYGAIAELTEMLALALVPLTVS